MSLRLDCPGCHVTYSVPDELRGKNVRCVRCQRTFLAPPAGPPEEEPLDVVPADEPAPVSAGLQSHPGRVPPLRPAPASGGPARPTKAAAAPVRRGIAPVVWIVGGV